MKPCARCGADIEKAYRHLSHQTRAKFCGEPCYRASLRKSYVISGDEGTFIVTPTARSPISPSDAEFAEMRSWHVDSQGYIAGSGGYRIHRLLLAPPDGMLVDHINRDKLDNRRENLRVVLPAVNVRNCKLHATNRSGVHGVWWTGKSWFAYIGAANTRHRLGHFKTFDAAVAARREAEARLWAMENK